MTFYTPFGSKSITTAESCLPSARGRKFSFLSSQRFALGGAILFGILIPEMLHPWFRGLMGQPHADAFRGFETSLIGSVIAIIAGHVSLYRFASLPTIDAKTYVAPAFLIPYATVVLALFLSNTLFGRYHFIVSFPVVVSWYFVIAVLQGRYARTRMAIIGESQHPITKVTDRIDWVALDHPLLIEPVSAIIVDVKSHLSPAWEHFIAQAVLAGIPVYDARHMMESLTRRVEIRHMADNSFGSLLPASTYIRLKRWIDLLAAIPLLIIFFPLIGIFGVAIRIDSRGPAIFRQQRTGFRGKPFTCYKLRSMRTDHDGPHFTAEHDDRVTRVGSFIRRFRIDELPQIINVLKGDMSWIGPRPEAIELAEQYEREIPFYVYRHAVRPGISGWAAVHQGNVAESEAAMIKLQYDFFYIKYCSLWLDMLIFFQTIRTIVTGFGSR